MTKTSSEIKKQKQQFVVILTIVFLGFLGSSMPYLIFPALFLNPEYSILPISFEESKAVVLLGITLAAYPLGQFIGAPILGALSDDYGRKQILSTSLLLAAFFNFLTGIAIEGRLLGLLIVSRFAAGLMEGNISIARAIAADMKTISKHKTFGKINAAASVAFILGPLIGGVMTDKNLLENLTTSTPFYVICVIFLGIAALSASVLKNIARNVSSEIKTFWQRIHLTKRMSELFVNKRLRFLMVTSTLFTLAVDVFYEFGPVYLTDKWSFGPIQLIIYNGVLCVGLAIGNGILPSFCASRISNKWAVICSMGGMALFLIGMVLASSVPVMLLLFALSGLVIGLAVTVLTVKISDSAPNTIQGEVMGVQLSLRVLGDAVICLFGGAVLLLSFKLILIIAAAISTLALMYYVLLFRSRKNA
jgi:MFS family permease